MPQARVNGVELSYDVQGQGLPVLFIHGGYGGAATTLVAQEQVVRSILPPERVQTIVYDRRSAGQSAYVLTPYTLADLVDDARALLDQLGVERAVIVGSSAGGPIALLFALTYPEHTLALGLPNTGADLLSEERPVGKERRALITRLEREGAEAVFASRKERLRQAPPAGVVPAGSPDAARLQTRQAAVTEALAEVSDADLLRYSTGEIRNFGAYQGYHLAARLGELTMPVCIIHGTADATVPFAWGEALQRAIPRAEFHAIEGGGHGILQWPEAASALRAWVLGKRGGDRVWIRQ